MLRRGNHRSPQRQVDAHAAGHPQADATAKVARRIARLTPSRCEATGSCTVRGYTCFAARATEELRLARCSKAHNGDELYRTVRFDYGS